MKHTVRTIAALMAVSFPLAYAAPAFAESKVTRSVPVTVTVPVMLQITSPAQEDTFEMPQTAQHAARRTVSFNGAPEAVTNQGMRVTQEWRRSADGRGSRLFTAVIR